MLKMSDELSALLVALTIFVLCFFAAAAIVGGDYPVYRYTIDVISPSGEVIDTVSVEKTRFIPHYSRDRSWFFSKSGSYEYPVGYFFKVVRKELLNELPESDR